VIGFTLVGVSYFVGLRSDGDQGISIIGLDLVLSVHTYSPLVCILGIENPVKNRVSWICLYQQGRMYTIMLYISFFFSFFFVVTFLGGLHS
jgi:hypothetical protein